MANGMGKRVVMTATAMAAALAVVAVGLVWADAAPSIDPDNAEQVGQGGAVYARECASCHGVRLEGQPDWRTRRADGKLPAPPQDASGHTWHHPDDQLFAIVKYGIARFAPPDYPTDMQSFVGKLTDDEIRAVLAYIKSSWPQEIRQRQAGLDQR